MEATLDDDRVLGVTPDNRNYSYNLDEGYYYERGGWEISTITFAKPSAMTTASACF
jgi:hypothetical protein